MTWHLKQALDQANRTNSIFKCSYGLKQIIQFQSFWHSPHPSILHTPLFVQGWGKWDKLTSRCSYFFPFRSNWKSHPSEDLTQKISQESWHYSRPLATNRRGNSLRTTEEFLRALLVKGVKGQHTNVWPCIYCCLSLCKTCLSSGLLLSTAAKVMFVMGSQSRLLAVKREWESTSIVSDSSK